MRIADLCKRHVITAYPETNLAEVARAMRNEHVGCVIVIDVERKPVGLLTDRDIVVETLACGVDPRIVTAGEIMTGGPVMVPAEQDSTWALKVMRDRGVRRLPVVDDQGRLVGIVALDDVLESAATGLYDVVQAMGTERLHEAQRRRAVA